MFFFFMKMNCLLLFHEKHVYGLKIRLTRVLQPWAVEHGSSILEAEPARQGKNTDAYSEALECVVEDLVSESGDSVSSGYLGTRMIPASQMSPLLDL